MDGDGGGEPVPGAQRERRERRKACNMCNRVMWYIVLCNMVVWIAYGGNVDMDISGADIIKRYYLCKKIVPSKNRSYLYK